MDTPTLKANDDKRHREAIKRLDDYIEQNLSRQDLVVKDIARAAYLSERQLFRLVKYRFRTTPYKYLQHRRMRRAHNLLRAGTYRNLQRTAKEVGYNRLDHFVKLYRQYFGVHPGQYFEK